MNKFLVYIAAFLVLVSCGSSPEEQERLSRQERQRLAREDSLALKIATTPTLDCLPLFVAKERRLFDTTLVDVRLKPYMAQMDGEEALVKGRVEVAASDLVRTERLRLKGVPVGYVTATNAYWQLVANRMARIKKPEQLGDKMVAMTRFSATDYLTDRTLQGVKTKGQVFRVQFNDVNIRLHMLLNNEMDALWLPEPQATTARLRNHTVLKDSRDYQLDLGVLAVNKANTRDARRQKQLQAFVKGYNRAVDSINQAGTAHYAAVIRKYCRADDKTVKALPKLVFKHAAQPDAAHIEAARKYAKAL